MNEEKNMSVIKKSRLGGGEDNSLVAPGEANYSHPSSLALMLKHEREGLRANHGEYRQINK